MRRIDADAVYQELRKRKAKFSGHRNLHNAAVCAGINEAIRVIGAAPTIDAVSVVRCGECIFADEIPKHKAHLIVEGYLACSLGRGDDTYNLSVVWPTEYCSEGTRKEAPHE